MTAHVDPIPLEVREYQGRRAGVVTRMVACFVDLAVVAVVLGLGYAGWFVVDFIWPPGSNSFSPPQPEQWLVLIAGHVVLVVYLMLMWRAGGRTYGCHVMGIRVADHRGRSLRLLPAFLRAEFCVLFPVGFFWVVVSRENRSLQDVVLRTSVVYDWDVRPGAGRVEPSSRADLVPQAPADPE